jgi:hypothetical protein
LVLLLLLLVLLLLLEGRRVSIVFVVFVFGLIAEGLGIADALTAGTAGTAAAVDAGGLGAKEEEEEDVEVGGARLGTAAAAAAAGKTCFCVGIGSLVLREGGMEEEVEEGLRGGVGGRCRCW